MPKCADIGASVEAPAASGSGGSCDESLSPPRGSSEGLPRDKRQRFELGTDAFDCPICSEPMLKRVFQCSAGHCVCEDCLERLRSACGGKCPSCARSYPEEAIRNLAMEGLVSQLTFPCRFGCGFSARPPELLAHLGCCELRTLPCVIPECQHRCSAKAMVKHLWDVHRIENRDHETTNEATHVVFARAGSYYETLSKGDATRRHDVLLGANGAHAGESPNSCLYIHSRQVIGGTFMAKALHFDQPAKYVLELKEGDHDSVTITGLSMPVTDAGGDFNIRLPLEVYERFLREDPATAIRACKVKIVAASP